MLAAPAGGEGVALGGETPGAAEGVALDDPPRDGEDQAEQMFALFLGHGVGRVRDDDVSFVAGGQVDVVHADGVVADAFELWPCGVEKLIVNAIVEHRADDGRAGDEREYLARDICGKAGAISRLRAGNGDSAGERAGDGDEGEVGYWGIVRSDEEQRTKLHLNARLVASGCLASKARVCFTFADALSEPNRLRLAHPHTPPLHRRLNRIRRIGPNDRHIRPEPEQP